MKNEILGAGIQTPPGCVLKVDTAGGHSHVLSQKKDVNAPPSFPSLGRQTVKLLMHNDLKNVPCELSVGMPPAFEGPGKRYKERCIESVSSKRIPYVGIGG
jgi:hypothetical protein